MIARIAPVSLVVFAVSAIATPAASQPKANVRVDSIRLTPSGTVAPNTPLSATVVFKNFGKEKSEGSVFETLWCQRGDSFFKPRDGAWSVLPTVNGCVPIQANVERRKLVLEGGATEEVRIDGFTARDTCSGAFVVQTAAGRNFTDPSIAGYVSIPVSVPDRDERKLTVKDLKVEQKKTYKRVKTKNKYVPDGIHVSFDYSVTRATRGLGPDRLVVARCRGERCWAAKEFDISSFKRQKVGNDWVEVASGEVSKVWFMPFENPNHENFNGSTEPDELRIIYGSRDDIGQGWFTHRETCLPKDSYFEQKVAF